LGKRRRPACRGLRAWDGAPEAFEIVEAAGLFGKDVNDEAAEIEQGPIVER